MPHARLSDPITSHLAADSITKGEVTTTQMLIISLLIERPKADYEIVRDFLAQYPNRASESGIRSRRKELVDRGVIVDTGERVQMPNSGRLAIVWSLA
jgi:hypothetical protein